MRSRSNPIDAAAHAYKVFHGHDTDEVFTFTRDVRYHSVLAGCGKLVWLEVESPRGDVVTLDHFKRSGPGGDCLLAMNEDRTQLYIRGGDQSVQLSDFAIDPRARRDFELLGELLEVGYFTTKTHLRPEDGGTANYQHEFGGHGKRLPSVVYDVMNRTLQIVGGDYKISPEGIVY